MQNLVVVSDIVSAHAGVPKKFRRTPGLTHCGQGHRLTPTNKLLCHMWYCTKF